MDSYKIVIKPLLTEKSYTGIANKRYTFVVHPDATKTQIKVAIEDLFPGVKVDSVNTMNYRGKFKRQGKTSGYTSSFKKAIVQLTVASPSISAFDSLGN